MLPGPLSAAGATTRPLPCISHLPGKLEARTGPANHGRGIFAIEPIRKDQLVAVWGGRIITADELTTLSDAERSHTLQVEEALYMAPVGLGDPADCVNHSCDPNAGMRGQITVVAMRDIPAGEEVCYDYAMTEASSYDEFRCRCGTDRCRARVTGEDWRLPELWERYEGYFSPYIQRRIEALKAASGGAR